MLLLTCTVVTLKKKEKKRIPTKINIIFCCSFMFYLKTLAEAGEMLLLLSRIYLGLFLVSVAV